MLAPAIDAAPVLTLDADDRVETASAAVAAHAAAEPDALAGRPLRELGAPFDALADLVAEARTAAWPVVHPGLGATALGLGDGRVALTLARPRAGAHTGAAGLEAEDILSSISDAFLAFDTEWRFIYVNKRSEGILERAADDLLGKVVWDEYPEAVGTPFEKAYREAVATGQPVQFDSYYEPFDMHFSVRAYPFPGGISVYYTDVTETRRMEAALRQSERQFRQIAETLPQLVWSSPADGVPDYFNERWYAFTGMPRPSENADAAVTRGEHAEWARYLHPDDADRARDRWQHSLETGEPYEISYRLLRTVDETYRWVIGRADPLFGPDGEVLRWFGTCTDIEDQKQAEVALRESEERFRLVSEITSDFAYGVRIRPDGALVTEWVLGAYEDILGVPADIGGSADAWAETLHPDDREAAQERFARLLDGQPIGGEYRICRPDGSCRWLRDTVRPTVGADGALSGFVGAASDVTAEKEAELALRQSRARLEMALEGGRIGSWEWDVATDTLTHDERAAELWAVEPGAIATTAQWFELVHPDDLPALREHVAEAVASRGRYHTEFRVLLPDGGVRWLAGRGSFVADEGEAGVLYGLNFDVTDRREQEEALRQKNAEMERFAYTVSHDLKSPLVTITGFLGLLKSHVAAGRTEPAVAAADRALGAADRMGRLIEDLLLLSRAGRSLGDPEPVDLDALAGRLAEEIAPRADAAGGTITVEPALGTVLADRQRVGEALENLLANAVRYGLGGGGSRVVVRSEPTRGGGLRLVVEDDGPGVPEPYRERVFDLFQKLDAQGDGTGVGLAVVARVMEVLGGSAAVRSAGGPPEREGARFVLTFPPRAVAASSRTPDAAPATSGTSFA